MRRKLQNLLIVILLLNFLFFSYVYCTATERGLVYEEEEVDENCVENTAKNENA